MDRFEHTVLFADVAARRHAHPPLEHRRQIGHDVSKHVRGNAHVVLLRLADQPLSERIDDGGVLLDLWVLRTDFAKDFEKELASLEHVVLGDGSDPLLSVLWRSLGPPPRQLEGVAYHALGTLASDHPGVDRQAALAADCLESPDPAVEPFGVLSHDHHVDLARVPDRHIRAVNAMADAWPKL